VPGYDIDSVPFAVARDNTGIILIDVIKHKSYKFADSPITENLFGHGDILKISGSAEDGYVLWTIMQVQGSTSAMACAVELPSDLPKALATLGTIKE
jgi:hypothetical protein